MDDIIIWGAGKIGRGFIADLFNNAGYRIVFVDKDKSKIQALNEKGAYSILKYTNDGRKEKTIIRGFTALHTSQKEEIRGILKKL